MKLAWLFVPLFVVIVAAEAQTPGVVLDDEGHKYRELRDTETAASRLRERLAELDPARWERERVAAGDRLHDAERRRDQAESDWRYAHSEPLVDHLWVLDSLVAELRRATRLVAIREDAAQRFSDADRTDARRKLEDLDRHVMVLRDVLDSLRRQRQTKELDARLAEALARQRPAASSPEAVERPPVGEPKAAAKPAAGKEVAKPARKK